MRKARVARASTMLMATISHRMVDCLGFRRTRLGPGVLGMGTPFHSDGVLGAVRDTWQGGCISGVVAVSDQVGRGEADAVRTWVNLPHRVNVYYESVPRITG
jgi:hypothetical protein